MKINNAQMTQITSILKFIGIRMTLLTYYQKISN
jgi:hypothetical protein